MAASKHIQFGQAAETLFLQGKSLEEIAALLGVARKTVGEWSVKGQWMAKRTVRATSPGEIAGFAEDILRAKLQELRSLPAEQIDAGKIDGLYKLLKAAERIAKETRLLEKAVLVMDAYIDYCKHNINQDACTVEFARINSFLSGLEGREG